MKYNAVGEYFKKAYIRLSSFIWHFTKKIVFATVIDNDALSLGIKFIQRNKNKWK